MTAVSPSPNKVILLGPDGRQVEELDGEAAVKFAHELMSIGEKALRADDRVHEG